MAAMVAAAGVAPWEKPNGEASDTVFVRRAALAITGKLPSVKLVQEYHGDKAQLVDELLASEAFVNYWTMRFCDVLRVKSEFPINLWPNAVYVYHRRVRDFVAKDEDWMDFARAVLSHQGSNFRVSEVNFLRATPRKTPQGLSEVTSLTFLGEATTVYSNYFAAVRYKPTREWKEEIVYFDGAGPEAFVDEVMQRNEETVRRNFMNIIAQAMFGPETKMTLGKTKLNVRAVVRAFALSPEFSAGSITGSYKPFRLDAEVIDDALSTLTGAGHNFTSIAPEPFTFLPSARPSVCIEDGSISSAFLTLFGRPARDSGTTTERDNIITAKQRLYLYNSGALWNRLSKLKQKSEQLYWLLYSRAPTAEERATIANANSRDVAWCLINSREFLYQH